MTIHFDDIVPGTSIRRDLAPDDLIVITGAGGFIAGALTRYFHDQGYTRIRAIDKKPLPDWHPLRTGDPESTHREGVSVRGWTVSEVEVPEDQWDEYVIDERP